MIEEELRHNRERLELTDAVLPDYAAWLEWCTKMNGKSLGEDFSVEETGPLVDGPWGSNRIGAAISRARDGFLHDLIIDRLNKGESVLVVYGGSHYLIHKPVLQAVLGSPCYSRRRSPGGA